MNRGPALSARRPCAQRRPWPARPSPLRCVPGRRQPGSVRAHTQVRPGRSRRARRWSAIGQRRRPAAVPLWRRHAKKEHDVIIISPRSFANHPLVVVLILLFRAPQDVAPSEGAHPPRWRAIFVVAQTGGIGKNTISCLF